MDAAVNSHRSFVQADPQWLGRLRPLLRGCVAVAALLALEAMCAVLFPALRQALPAWMTMKADTSVLVLASALSMEFSEDHWPLVLRSTGRALALFVALMAAIVLLEYALPAAFGSLASWLPERMALQTAGQFALLGIVMLLPDTRRRAAAVLADACLAALCLADLVLASGYLFGATHLFGLLRDNAAGPETLLAMMLLTFIALGRRAESGGVFVVLLGNGIGSKMARIACPIILVLPFLLEVARDRGQRAGWIGPQYGAAIETSVAAMLTLALMLLLAWRIERLEREVRGLSLRDALTGLYNRRGFYLFAEQSLEGARRSRAPLSVLYIDLDNLKQINDSLGHDVGSKFLCEVADLLKESFRRTDVVGRIGGDEFVVAGASSAATMHSAVQRLQEAAAARGAQPGRLYPFSFSLGFATSGAGHPETLEEMLTRADRNMYEIKRRKKLLRE